MRRTYLKVFHANHLVVFAYRILLAYLLFVVARLLFYLFNHGYFADMTSAQLARVWYGGFRFDTAAVLYLNLLFIVLSLLPFHFRERRIYHRCVDAAWYIPNLSGLLAGIADAVYYPFTLKRTTADVFSEFANEGAGMFLHLFLQYWHVTLLGVVLTLLFILLYRRVRIAKWIGGNVQGWKYYTLHTSLLLFAIFLVIGGFRGFNFSRFLRPLAIGHSNAYVDKIEQRSLVLNTPYCIIRTIGKQHLTAYNFFPNDETAEQVFNPIHDPRRDSVWFGALRGRNVMIVIVESFARQYVGSLNKDLENYKGYTPCFDSIAREGFLFQQAFANGRISIDAMPALLASIPKLNEHFVTSAYALNNIGGLGTLLGAQGYSSQFFHGGTNGTMNFDAFVKQAGYQHYFGRTEYANDADFDGIWGVWDVPFLQRTANELSKMPEPFLGTVFTVSSHGPYQMPEEYIGRFPDEGEPLVKCIGYTDYALGKFFQKICHEPWFNNTLFVVTADHASGDLLEKYRTPVLRYAVPMLLYAPGSNLQGLDTTTTIQHADLLPTLLTLLGYEHPVFGYGNDMLDAHVPHFAINEFDGLFQLIENGYVLQHDGTQPVALYDYLHDNALQNNLLAVPELTEQSKRMQRHIEAILQSYSSRMRANQLRVP